MGAPGANVAQRDGDARGKAQHLGVLVDQSHESDRRRVAMIRIGIPVAQTRLDAPYLAKGHIRADLIFRCTMERHRLAGAAAQQVHERAVGWRGCPLADGGQVLGAEEEAEARRELRCGIRRQQPGLPALVVRVRCTEHGGALGRVRQPNPVEPALVGLVAA